MEKKASSKCISKAVLVSPSVSVARTHECVRPGACRPTAIASDIGTILLALENPAHSSSNNTDRQITVHTLTHLKRVELRSHTHRTCLISSHSTCFFRTWQVLFPENDFSIPRGRTSHNERSHDRFLTKILPDVLEHVMARFKRSPFDRAI
jgi:hypothetical protein